MPSQWLQRVPSATDLSDDALEQLHPPLEVPVKHRRRNRLPQLKVAERGGGASQLPCDGENLLNLRRRIVNLRRPERARNEGCTGLTFVRAAHAPLPRPEHSELLLRAGLHVALHAPGVEG